MLRALPLAAMLAALAAVLVPVPGQAGALEGARTILLHPGDGPAIAVGEIRFTDKAETTGYEIHWDDSKFGEHFLSMRPFKCLEGPEKYWCRVPYPYENQRRVTAEDLTDLEYDLLFLWKGAGEYGINMWNGVYYRLEAREAGLEGRLHEVDMDILAAPPETGDLRPIGPHDLEEGDTDSHWLPRLTIE